MDNARAKEIAETIFQQLGGTRRLATMTGARDFSFGVASAQDAENAGLAYARFRIGEGAKNDVGVVSVFYDNAPDTYSVEFWRAPSHLSRSDLPPGTRAEDYWEALKQRCRVSRHTDIYFDQLMDLFERETGFYLTLSPRTARP
jgi:hypothetical protein